MNYVFDFNFPLKYFFLSESKQSHWRSFILLYFMDLIVVGVRADPWAIWMSFSLQNCFMSWLSNSLPLSVKIFFG